MTKTIFITGVSSGLGRAIACAALAGGHVVVGTVRDEPARQAFEAVEPGRAIGRILDVTATGEIEPLVRSIEAEHGAIDVLVNNAGYGHKGVVEELDLADLRRQFEVNLYGPIALIQAVLPGMRLRGGGHIINMASMGGVATFPGLGAYHGSKFALLGMSDTLAQELKPLGIRVTSVLPGVYRSDWGSRSLSEGRRDIRDYDWVFDDTRQSFSWGDPAALARVMVELIALPDPPRRLLVGPTALKIVRGLLEDFAASIDRWEALSEADGEG